MIFMDPVESIRSIDFRKTAEVFYFAIILLIGLTIFFRANCVDFWVFGICEITIEGILKQPRWVGLLLIVASIWSLFITDYLRGLEE